jgi:hypothetical protein
MTPPAARISGAIRSLLPGMTIVLLVAAWWLSLIVILPTPIVNLTPPKIVALVALLLLLAARFWALIARTDRLLMLLTVAYVGWLILTAVLRGSGPDLKLTLGYAIFFGGAFALAYTAARAQPNRAAIAIVAAVLGALVVTVIGVALERFTYAGQGAPDPLAGLWALVRPQGGTFAPGLGPPPLHFATGDPAVPRISSWFAHANYLAFFTVLAAGLTATLLLAMLRRRKWLWASAVGVCLALCVVTTVWTYSRAGLIGLLTVVVVVVVTDVIRRAEAWRSWSSVLLRGTPVVLVLVVLTLSVAADDVGLRRLAPLVSEDPVIPANPTPSIEVSAARSSAIRLAMQMAALELVTESPRSLLLGPGQATFDMAVHDPASPQYVAEGVGIVDPNSLWLSLGVSGGIPAAGLLASVLALTWLRLLAAVQLLRLGPRAWLIAWLAAWIPTWGLLQFVGTFPFNPSEAMILGTLLGAAIAQSGLALEPRPEAG